MTFVMLSNVNERFEQEMKGYVPRLKLLLPRLDGDNTELTEQARLKFCVTISYAHGPVGTCTFPFDEKVA